MKAVMTPRTHRTVNQTVPSCPASIAISRTRSLDQNPLKNGNPAMDRDPRSMVIEVIFMCLWSPPISLMSSVPTAWMTDPEHMNSRALKKAWFIMWKHPAVNPATPAVISAVPSAPPMSIPSATRYPPAPRARIMYPSWETVENARTFLMFMLLSAMVAANMAVTPPMIPTKSMTSGFWTNRG